MLGAQNTLDVRQVQNRQFVMNHFLGRFEEGMCDRVASKVAATPSAWAHGSGVEEAVEDLTAQEALHGAVHREGGPSGWPCTSRSPLCVRRTDSTCGSGCARRGQVPRPSRHICVKRGAVRAPGEW